MASEILGLFTSPQDYRAMQDQQTQREAIQYAGLTPFQRADVSLYTGGKQLGQATGSLFGMQDPQLRKITARQQMISGTNPLGSNLPPLDFTNPVQLREASIFALQQNRDPEFAEFLAKKAEEVQLNQATITAKLRAKPENVAASVQAAEARADAMRNLNRLKKAQKENPTPEGADEIAYYENIVNSLPIKTEGLVREQQIARDLALAEGPEDSDAYKTAYAKNLRDLTTKAAQEKLGEFERVLNSRYPANNPENADKRAQLMDQFLANEITGRKTKGSTEVKVGIDTGKAGEAAGKIIGEKLAGVPEKQSALDSLSDAQSMLKQGIYAGGYGAAGKFAAKYTGIGSADKLARTEAFTAYIGNVVIPRLRDFGGSDSNEELKYLRSVTGGDIDLEPKALKLILEQAERNIKRGMERLRTQAESGEAKKPLSTLVPRGVDNTGRPSEPAMTLPNAAPAPAAVAPSGMPKATKRWNPQLRKLEVIK